MKPTSEDGSIGIDAAAVVNSVKELMERLSYIQTEFDSPALIEEYIEGREIYAAVLGNYENPYPLPLVELDLSKLPKGVPRIASSDVKFEKDSEAYKLTKSAIAEDLMKKPQPDSPRSRSKPIAPSGFAIMGALTCAYRVRARSTSSKRIRIHGSRAGRSFSWPRRNQASPIPKCRGDSGPCDGSATLNGLKMGIEDSTCPSSFTTA